MKDHAYIMKLPINIRLSFNPPTSPKKSRPLYICLEISVTSVKTYIWIVKISAPSLKPRVGP